MKLKNVRHSIAIFKKMEVDEAAFTLVNRVSEYSLLLTYSSHVRITLFHRGI